MPFVRHLVIFTRYPAFGTGKTRLAAGAGRALAWRFQRVTLALMLRRLGRNPRWTTWLAVTPDRSGPWLLADHVLPQGHGNLGQRMSRIAKRLSCGPVVIVGSDSPSIRAAHISRAFHALGGCDAVLGPATDGGYWLIGLRRRPHFLDPFTNVRWSTEYAAADTLSNLRGSTVAVLDALDDVDDAESLARLPRWNMLHATR